MAQTVTQIQAQAEQERRRRVEKGMGFATISACQASPQTFINSYCLIDDVQLTLSEKGIFPFLLWPKQDELLDVFREHQKVLILKARQLGISWLICAYILWKTLFYANQMCLIFSRSQDEANELLRRVRVLYERLPALLRMALPKPSAIWGMESLEWNNGSRVKAFPSTPNAGRTYTASVVVIDECAFIQWDRGLYNALKPTIDGGGQLIVLSTANGVDNLFFDLWEKTIGDDTAARPSSFTTVFLSCLDRPDRDQAWYRDMEAEALDPYLFRQEYPLSADEAFVISARNPFLPSPYWWDACHGSTLAAGASLTEFGADGNPFFPTETGSIRRAMVLALDGAVSGASFGMVGASRHPKERDHVLVRFVHEYRPDGRPLDYRAIKQDILHICKVFNVAQIAYDPYQLHQMMQEMELDYGVWVDPFSQQGERMVSDSRLLALIRDRQIEHQGQTELRDHIMNADRKVDAEQHKLRIVTGRGPVDLAVSLSMCAHRSLELNI